MAAPTRATTLTVPYSTKASGVTAANFGLITADVGDVLVLRAMSEDSSITLSRSDDSAGALTWILQRSDTTPNRCAMYIWTSTVSSFVSNVTVTLTASAAAHTWGGRINQWTGSGGVGTSALGTPATTNPSLSLTGVLDNSAIDAEVGDWNAGATAGVTWGGTATPTSETATQLSGLATFYEAYYADAGAAGTKTVSLGTLTGSTNSIAAVEIKGLSSAGVNYAVDNRRGRAARSMRARR